MGSNNNISAGKTGILGLLVALLLLLAPAAAHAGELNDQAWVKQGLNAAYKHWGAWPAACTSIRVASATPDESEDALARVIWVPTIERPLTPDGCQILVNKTYLPVAPAYNGPEFCTVIVHEFGHLLGWAHPDDPSPLARPSSDPVMRHDIGDYIAPECKPVKAKVRKTRARKAVRR